jgi:hypothetical protein
MKKKREENGNCLSTKASKTGNSEGNDIRKDDNHWRVPGFRRPVEYKDHVGHLISPVSQLNIESPTTPRIKASPKEKSSGGTPLSPTTAETPRTTGTNSGTRRRQSMSGLISIISPPITPQTFLDWQGHASSNNINEQLVPPAKVGGQASGAATSPSNLTPKERGFVRRNTRRRNDIMNMPAPGSAAAASAAAAHPRKARSSFSPKLLAALDGGGPPRKSRSTFSAELLTKTMALDHEDGMPTHQQGEDRHLGLGFEFSRLNSDRCLNSKPSGKDSKPESSSGRKSDRTSIRASKTKERRSTLSRNASESSLSQKVKSNNNNNKERQQQQSNLPRVSSAGVLTQNGSSPAKVVKEFGRKNSLVRGSNNNKERRPNLSRVSSEGSLYKNAHKVKEVRASKNKERRPNLSRMSSDRSLDRSSGTKLKTGSSPKDPKDRRFELARMSSESSLHQKYQRKSKGPVQKIHTARNESIGRQQILW